MFWLSVLPCELNLADKVQLRRELLNSELNRDDTTVKRGLSFEFEYSMDMAGCEGNSGTTRYDWSIDWIELLSDNCAVNVRYEPIGESIFTRISHQRRELVWHDTMTVRLFPVTKSILSLGACETLTLIVPFTIMVGIMRIDELPNERSHVVTLSISWPYRPVRLIITGS